ncbi:hypothetical protein HGA89_06430 [bacterium]|nr:hypothetical protein [bacterium]
MKNWTVNAGETLQRAQTKAYESGHAELEPLHLLWSLLSETGLAGRALRSLETDSRLVLETVERELASLPVVQVKEVPNPGRAFQQLVLEAQSLAGKDAAMVGTRELLLALAADRGRAGSLLQTFGVTPEKLARALEALGADQAYRGDDEAGVADGG